ncbi:hypothetical protein QVD17_02691 [Tagetes erecta]|uniref:Uncharacterized protein n=1 Tax=Tagetes erecta TaxID=13708 RepID=A0AAD8P9A6_TARER|nr:hypothetical protein QVD17_02691 [Tagetes erecta]
MDAFVVYHVMKLLSCRIKCSNECTVTQPSSKHNFNFDCCYDSARVTVCLDTTSHKEEKKSKPHLSFQSNQINLFKSPHHLSLLDLYITYPNFSLQFLLPIIHQCSYNNPPQFLSQIYHIRLS